MDGLFRLTILLILGLQLWSLQVEAHKCHVCSDVNSKACREGGKWLSSNPLTIQQCGTNNQGKSAAHGCLVLLLELSDPGDEEGSTTKTIIYRDCLYSAYIKCHAYWNFITDLNRPGIQYHIEFQGNPSLRSYMECVHVERLSLGLEPLPYKHIPKQQWGRKNIQLNIQNGILTNAWPIGKVFPSIISGRSGYLSADGLPGMGLKPRQNCSLCVDSRSRYCQEANEWLGSGALPTCSSLGVGIPRNADGCQLYADKPTNQRHRPMTTTVTRNCLFPGAVECYYVECTNIIAESISAVMVY